MKFDEQQLESAMVKAIPKPKPGETKLHPNAIGDLILKKLKVLTLMEGILYRYTGTHWEHIRESYLKALALQLDSQTTKNRRNETSDYIKHKSLVPNVEWRRLAINEIPFQNGVLNVETDEVRPHRSEDYLEAVIPHEFVPNAECPIWLNALDTYFAGPDAAEKTLALQQFFGYCLLPHARYKKALILYGDSDTGKSQPLAILREIVGIKNCAGVSVEAMDDPRARVQLMGKMVNVLTELTSKSIVADGGFKTLISTEEPLLFDAKYEAPVMYIPFAKHVIACNELPSINDRTKATYNRLLMIQFNNVLPIERQDRGILDKFKSEIHGIIQWAVNGACHLIRTGGEFVTIQQSEDTIKEYRNVQNEVAVFIDERCSVDPDSSIPCEDFRAKFLTWSGKHYSPRAIGAMSKNAGFPVKPTYDKHNQKTIRSINGIRWSF